MRSMEMEAGWLEGGGVVGDAGCWGGGWWTVKLKAAAVGCTEDLAEITHRRSSSVRSARRLSHS